MSSWSLGKNSHLKGTFLDKMATSSANITSPVESLTRIPAESQSVDSKHEVGLLESVRRAHQPLAREPMQSNTVQDYFNFRSMLFTDVSSDLKDLRIPTGSYKVGPSFSSFRVKLTKDVRDEMQKALATQATLVFEEKSPFVVLRAKTSLDYQQGRAPDSSTSSDGYSSHLRIYIVEHLMETVRIASEEVFVDGMESVLSEGLSMLIETYGDIAVSAVEHVLGLYYDRAEIVGESLRQLGQIEDPQTHRSRLTALVAHLDSSDPRVRDAANLGLAALDDPKAIKALKYALERESSPQLRSNLELVLVQLQSTLWQDS